MGKEERQANLQAINIYDHSWIFSQTRKFEFKVQNVGNVPLKIAWSFVIDDEYPARIDKLIKKDKVNDCDCFFVVRMMQIILIH